jgi:hypothetical protein
MGDGGGWTSGDGRWNQGQPPEGWWLASDGRWYPPIPSTSDPTVELTASGESAVPRDAPPIGGAEEATRTDRWWMSGDGQWNQGEPPGDWWLASNSRWYPPHVRPAVPAVARSNTVWATYKAWPRWARIVVPIAAAFLLLVGVAAVAGEPDQNGDRVATADAETTTTDQPSTTKRTTTSQLTTTTSTTSPPTTTTTAPPTTTTTAPPPPPTPAPAPPPPPPTTASPAPAENCHPSYDPCVPVASDVDCAGGSGNGPAYTGTVSVIGPDVYGLDSDGDGVGCE